MPATTLLVTDRPAVLETWQVALQHAGLASRVVPPSELRDLLHGHEVVVLDGGAAFFDEDELLAHAGLVRALGGTVAVHVPEDGRLRAVDDLLTDLCLGLVVRHPDDVAPVTQVLARRADSQRGRRFEYLTVSPRPSELLAILGDGRSVLLKRPLGSEDDGSEVAAIGLAEDAETAELTLVSDAQLTLRAADLADLGAETGATVAMNGHPGSIDGAKLGARLRELRLAAGLTQAELARRTGIHRPNIARVEAGRHTPSLETLSRLAGAIGVSTTRVLSGE